MAQMSRTTKRLEFVTTKVHGQAVEASLDSGAVSNMMSPALSELFSLKPFLSLKRIITAEGVSLNVMGALKDFALKFGSVSVPLDFPLPKGTPFEVINDCLVLEVMPARLDIGRQELTLSPGKNILTLGLNYERIEPSVIDSLSNNDSENFTSDVGRGTSGSETDEKGLIAA